MHSAGTGKKRRAATRRRRAVLETEAPGSHFILGAADRGVQGTRVVSGTLAGMLWAAAHGLELKGKWLTWSSGNMGSNLTRLYFPCYGPNASAPLYRRHGHGRLHGVK